MVVRAIFWKELREHRLQALILLALGIVILAGLLPLLESDFRPDNFRVLLAACFAWACGMVTGAILLANESESMTQTFLDVLPRKRSQLWWSKASFGLILTVVESLVLAGVCLVMRQPGVTTEQPAEIVLLNLLGGLFGLSCGLFGSSLGRTVLAAIGWSVVALFGSALAMGAGIAALTPLLDRRSEDADGAVTFLAFILALPLPLALSGLFYTRLDRQRSYRLPVFHRPRMSFAASRLGIVQTLWLSFKQGWVLNLFLGAVALVAGPLMLVDPYAVWPIATLLIGLLAGVGVVGDEQFYGSFRFLAEQRLPLGRFWALKVGSRLLVAIVLAGVVLLVGGLAAQLAASVESRSVSERWLREDGRDYVRQMGQFTALSVWLLYGFAFGHLAGILARKTFIAFAIAVTAAVTCLAIWLPSMLGGGLPAWQALAIPVGLLVLARISLWKWATDRLYSRRSLALWGAAAVLGVAFIALALANRVWEVPKVSEPFDVAAFESQYPSRAENEVRSKLYSAKSKFDDRKNARSIAAPVLPGQGQADAFTRMEDLLAAAEFGWPKNNRRLEIEVEDICGGEWMALLTEVAALPPSVVDDPRDMVLTAKFISSWVGEMCHWLAARAIQLQSRGDHAGALDLIATQLALARHVLTRSTSFPFMIGSNIESSALQTLETWSSQPRVSPDLLERALKLVREHESKRPPFTDNVKPEYLLQREYIAQFASEVRGNSRNRDWKAAVLATTMLTPWETARRQRMLDGLGQLNLEAVALDFPTTLARVRSNKRPDNSNDKSLAREIYASLPPSKDEASEKTKQELAAMMQTDLWFTYVAGYIRSTDARRFMGPCRCRGAEIRLALLLFQHRHGRPAAKLDELVPELLSSIPIDPFSEQPFNYRLIDAEEWLLWPKQAPVWAKDWGVEDTPAFGGFGGPMGGGPPMVPGMPMGGAPGDQELDANKPPPRRFGPVTPGQPSATHRRVKPGYGVIWSVGPDGLNDGGNANSDSAQIPIRNGQMTSRGADVLFVVPNITKPSAKPGLPKLLEKVDRVFDGAAVKKAG